MRKVIYAKLHGDFFVAGIGGFGSTLPAANKSQTMEMGYSEMGLEVKVSHQGLSKTALVPPGSVFMVIFAPEDKPKLVEPPSNT